jgi:hypothetical protein
MPGVKASVTRGALSCNVVEWLPSYRAQPSSRPAPSKGGAKPNRTIGAFGTASTFRAISRATHELVTG